MKFKNAFAFLLIFVLLLSLCACGAPEEGAPSEETVETMTDEEMVTHLLGKYNGLNFPAVSYEVSSLFRLSDAEIRTKAAVSVKGKNLSAFTETTVGDLSVDYNFIYADGILYLEALGTKVRGPASEEDAQAALDQQLPFIAEDLGAFRRKDLLRSEDGSCLVVLSEPSVDMTSLLNLSAVASEEGSEEGAGIRFLKTEDFYLSLSFTAGGALQKMTVGGKVTLSDEGAESQMEMEVVYRILSTDASQIAVTAPADSENYQVAEEDSSNTDSADSSDDSET